jgi:hypothetical protein
MGAMLALLLFAFASGGGRRDEVVGLRFDQLVENRPFREFWTIPPHPSNLA